MQRRLLAAAVASAFAMPALAEVPAEIQIYGRVNVSGERITVDNSTDPTVPNQSNYELVDNSSRIGVRGNKELTPGLKAIFQIESRVRLDTGGSVSGETAFLSSRDSYAGLQGGFGTIRAGRTIGPVYYATYDYISMHNHDTGTSSDALLAGTAVGNQGFMNNTLWYTSPKFGPITIDVAFSLLGEDRLAPGVSQPRHLGLVAAYDQGPLHAAVSFANTENDHDLDPGAPVAPNSDTALTIGGLYDFKAFVIGALFERAESDLLGGKAKRNYWRVSGMVPVGQHEFHLNVGNVNHRLDANLSDDGANQYTIAYNYNITKTTKVYAFYTVVDNDTNGNYGFVTNSPGADNKSIALGFRHNF
jgi:predicted porin